MATSKTEQAYNDLYALFMAIPEEEVTRCTIPLDVASSEAKQLSIVADQDRNRLRDAGIDMMYVDTLEARCDAFTYAAAMVESLLEVDPDAVKAWKAIASEGYDLQRYLFRVFTFAFRRDKTLSKSVARIKQGKGDKEMILDLLSLSILGDEHPEPLAAMPMFDTEKLQEAKALHERLAEIYARANIDPDEVTRAQDILNRAYTYYKQAADEVKDHGQFVFEGTDRYNSYVSEYRRNLGKRSHSTTGTSETESDATPEAV